VLALDRPVPSPEVRESPNPWRKYTPAGLAAVIGLAVSALAFMTVGNLEELRLRSEFEQKSTLRARALAHALEGSLNELNSIVDLFGALRVVERREFRAFVIPALSRQRQIQAFEWMPRVPDALRPAHEAATRREGRAGYAVTERDQQGRLIPSRRRDEYFPVHYRESLKDPNPKAGLGFDVGSNPSARLALERARDTGAPAASGRVPLMSAAGAQTGFLVFLPVYRTGVPLLGVAEHRENLLGFVGATYHIGELVEAALVGSAPEGLNFKVIDRDASGTERALYFHKSRTLSEHEYPLEDEPDIRAGLHFPTAITVAGRPWELLFYPTPRHVASHRAARRWEVLGASVLATALLAMYLISVAGRAARVERLVAQRTSELSAEISERRRAEEAATRAREEAERAASVKTDFLATMSHEIRTPMNGVIGMIGLLLDTELSPRQREFAETARSSAESLLSIINDILDFSKGEAGKMTLESIPFDLRLAIEEVAELLAVRARDKGLDVIVRYAPETPRYVVGDPGRVRQVLLNLASNAIKFTEAGHVLMNAECESRTDGAALLRLSVQDTGIGIPADKLEMVFEKFTQSDASTTRRYGGTGLGLAICKQLVTLMGGTIGAESTPGRGSTFRFTLPVPVAAPLAAASLPSDELNGVRVLIVDDNEVNRRVLHEQIVNWGMRNGSVASGKTALAKLREAHAAGDPYQIAIVDLQMPEMDGETLGRLIKADPLLNDTLLVMLTSLGERNDMTSLQEVGFSGFLVKPVRQSQLMDALATIWAARNQGRAAALLTLQTLAASRAAKRVTPTPRPAGEPIHARVLLVEDNPTNQQIGCLMLEKLGCRVDVAGNGREAIEILSMVPYDVVFMDCQMPEMDGYEATAEIRRREAEMPWRAPIIAMTANAMQGDREKCLAAGMDDYVSKPVRPRDLDAVLRRWFKAPDPKAGASALTNGPAVALDPVAFEEFMSLAGTDVSLLEELVETFFTEAVARLGAMRQAASVGDADGIRKAAHALKGSSSGLGAPGMADLCDRLEMQSSAEPSADTIERIGRLEAEFGRVRDELDARLRRSGLSGTR
jgi:signal transduction histidine kinase/DNA-binding response OmpR family regulator